MCIVRHANGYPIIDVIYSLLSYYQQFADDRQAFCLVVHGVDYSDDAQDNEEYTHKPENCIQPAGKVICPCGDSPNHPGNSNY